MELKKEKEKKEQGKVVGEQRKENRVEERNARVEEKEKNAKLIL
tara:strand:+ start:220 stop:351 length:132 start_codon:yes stop_codon:yes gene_type:complete